MKRTIQIIVACVLTMIMLSSLCNCTRAQSNTGLSCNYTELSAVMIHHDGDMRISDVSLPDVNERVIVFYVIKGKKRGYVTYVFDEEIDKVTRHSTIIMKD